MAGKVTKPSNYGKDSYSPQTETARVPAQPHKQENQGGSQEKKK